MIAVNEQIQTEPRRQSCPDPNAYDHVPFQDYVTWEATNWSTLKPFAVSALQGRYEMTQPPDATCDQIFGAAFHAAILEPAVFKRDYVTMPRFEGHPNSNVHKAAKQAWVDANTTKIHLTADEMVRLTAMQKRVFAHPTTTALLRGKGRNELSFVWVDKETGETCKGRIDRLCRVPANVIDPSATGDVICEVDFKKTCNLERFDNEIAKFKYHGQRAFYCDGLAVLEPAPITSIIVAVQDHEPYDVVPYNMNEAIPHGRKLYRRLLQTLITCRKTDRWPGICPTGTFPVDLPRYAQETDAL